MDKQYFIFIIFSFLLLSCQSDSVDSRSQEQVLEEFTTQFNQFYETYSNADPSFLDMYADDVISIDTNGDRMRGSEPYRDAIIQMFDTYEIDLLDYTQPELVYSDGQIVSFNDYEELFITKSTGDTTRVEGTWIGVWQHDGEKWVVKMNTFHIKE